MSNIKTWPEIIYQPNINFRNNPNKLDMVEVENDDIKYIREDVVKERISRLIKCAFENGRDMQHLRDALIPYEESTHKLIIYNLAFEPNEVDSGETKE